MVSNANLSRRVNDFIQKSELRFNGRQRGLLIDSFMGAYLAGIVDAVLLDQDQERHRSVTVTDSVRRLRTLGARVAIDKSKIEIRPRVCPLEIVEAFKTLINRDAPDMIVTIESSR